MFLFIFQDISENEKYNMDKTANFQSTKLLNFTNALYSTAQIKDAVIIASQQYSLYFFLLKSICIFILLHIHEYSIFSCSQCALNPQASFFLLLFFQLNLYFPIKNFFLSTNLISNRDIILCKKNNYFTIRKWNNSLQSHI